MSRRHGIVLNALMAVLALVSAILRFLDGAPLFSTILLLLAVLNAVALILNLKQKESREKKYAVPSENRKGVQDSIYTYTHKAK